MRSAAQIATRKQAREDPVVARFRERVLSALGDGVERIVLFGSRARGDETPDDRFEGVVHGAYYAMFHAARAALLALEGSASTNHGRVVETFEQAMRRRRIKEGREHAAVLAGAAELRIKADYSHEDLTDAGRSLRAQVRPFLEFCRKLVDTAAGGG
jgi:uncharacterized protein (UPF0332 family)